MRDKGFRLQRLGKKPLKRAISPNPFSETSRILFAMMREKAKTPGGFSTVVFHSVLFIFIYYGISFTASGNLFI